MRVDPQPVEITGVQDDTDEEDPVLSDHFIRRRAAEERLLYQPTVIDRFHQQGPMQTRTGNGLLDDRRTELRGFDQEFDGSAENVGLYAPFASRIDWEIAKWAKTRGPGSNALDELLAIDGVRHYSPSTIANDPFISSDLTGGRPFGAFIQELKGTECDFRQESSVT